MCPKGESKAMTVWTETHPLVDPFFFFFLCCCLVRVTCLLEVSREAAVVADAGDEGETSEDGHHLDDRAKDVEHEPEGEEAEDCDEGGGEGVEGDEGGAAGAGSDASEDGRDDEDDRDGDESGILDQDGEPDGVEDLDEGAEGEEASSTTDGHVSGKGGAVDGLLVALTVVVGLDGVVEGLSGDLVTGDVVRGRDVDEGVAVGSGLHNVVRGRGHTRGHLHLKACSHLS